jgi:type I restriction enzyme M protein
MARTRKSGTPKPKSGNGANLGFEQKLWAAADKMRGHMDAAEYKHVALGLIFLKYISDAFQERYDALKAEPHADPEDRDEYAAENVFWVPPSARWQTLQAAAKSPEIGKTLDAAMDTIEKENPTLKGVLPKDYARPALDKTRLGELIDLIGTIALVARDEAGLFGPRDHRSQDVLGRVYEYFLGRFAAAEGKAGGEFFTPRSVVKLLVEMIEPYKGRVFDPCCGSGGMFVQSEKFVEAHGGRRVDLSIFGEESNPTTWRLCKMNLAIRGIEANLGAHNADSFHNDLHKEMKADFVLANPPFNVSDWGGDRLRGDSRWKYGTPPVSNANFAWVQHFIHHLAPNGVAGFVLANGSMASNTSGEGEIRRAIVEADLVDCMIALPGQLFYTTQIPACLWFLARNKASPKFRDRRGYTLFIDARKLGRLADRTHRELTEAEITRIARIYHTWRGEKNAGTYADVPGFCKSASKDDVASHGFVLTPGRYVGAADVEDDGQPFDEKMKRLAATLKAQFAESAKLERTITANLKGLGYGA